MVLQRDWAWHSGVMALSGTFPFLDRMGGSPVGTVPSHTNGSRPPPPNACSSPAAELLVDLEGSMQRWYSRVTVWRLINKNEGWPKGAWGEEGVCMCVWVGGGGGPEMPHQRGA